MRSRTSRGVPEWSDDEDRYIGRRVLESGSVPGVSRYGQHDRKVFREPRQVLGGFMGQGNGENQPTKRLCTPLTYSHVTRGFGAPHLGFPPPGLGAKSPKGEIPSALAAPPPLGETLGRLPLSLPPIYRGGFGAAQHTSLSIPRRSPTSLPPHLS